jgi:DNA-binding response OmpR family regulator
VTSTEQPRSTELLVVEDDDRIASAMVAALQRHGYMVQRVGTVADALSAGRADLVLLDLRLPDGDGVYVCRQLRERDPDIPIIMVTARTSPVERVHGLRLGADDYVAKPFAIAELVARIEAVLRRVPRREENRVIVVDDVTVDVVSRRVEVDGQPVALTRKEFDLLVLILGREGDVMTRPELLDLVWHTSWEGSTRTVDVHVAQVRHKLRRPGLIETVHGIGYRARVEPCNDES